MTDLAVNPFADLDDSFVREVPELTLAWEPQSVPAPALLALNEQLAHDLGLDIEALKTPDGIALLAGASSPDGTTPVAMGYAGHQFGGYSPRLGDGRAVLLGELVDAEGRRFDVHLKGSGRTIYSRGGDGKASVGPMLREFLFAEAMHALGVPTTRALAVVTTGEHVVREEPEPGAVLTRVAASHLRVGTFEFAARHEDPSILLRLADYALARHYPHLVGRDDRYASFLEAVVDAQAALVAKWMLIGFVHGVLNTDNVLISGETIDYGPCAFMDRFDQATVFSSIDHQGRYAYGNQPAITQWNLTRLAETFIPLLGDDADAAVAQATEILEGFSARFIAYWQEGMRAKLGLAEPADTDEALFDDYIEMLHHHRVDYTSSYRALAASLRGDVSLMAELFGDGKDIAAWTIRWHAAIGEATDQGAVADAMDAINPIYIPRNHLVDEALHAANKGDTDAFHELLAVLIEPFTERAGFERFAQPAPDSFNESFKTFCGT